MSASTRRLFKDFNLTAVTCLLPHPLRLSLRCVGVGSVVMLSGSQTPLKGAQYNTVGSTTSSEAATTQTAGVDTLISPTSVSCLSTSSWAGNFSSCVSCGNKCCCVACYELVMNICRMTMAHQMTEFAFCRSNMRRTCMAWLGGRCSMHQRRRTFHFCTFTVSIPASSGCVVG